ncbi:MAG: D-glycero-beta-D-manno-heptose 1,7-bisphosphate 7-phosphatase [gamma proteobacterium symbiont of Taylorina sp.]|nr:D-glycero-beta-D-manno-heptose 1,7-bisphosphate 7-phosphatase [gamma proteobacterium symbiont of Taylorina sp.]
MKKSQAAVFLDRDGVINEDHAYVYKIQKFQFIPGVFEACRQFIRSGYQIIIITNQSGIARGFYSEDDFKRLTDWMCNQFKEQGVIITDVYYCPHHSSQGQDQYKVDCDCRKPKPGMIKQAETEHHINLKKSILIGDKLGDIKAGIAAGVGHNYLVKSGKPVINEISELADGIYDNLFGLSKSAVYPEALK